MSKIRLTPMMNLKEQFDHVDDPDAVERAKTNRALKTALDWLRPRNWHGSGLTPDQVLPIASENGIPVAWVPPRTVLIQLAEAEPERRIAVLMANEEDVLADCRHLIERCDDAELSDARTLAGRALLAFEEGHHEAAMALAVAVAEQPAIWASKRRVMSFETEEEREDYKKAVKKKYSLAERELQSSDVQSRLEVPRRALLSPIPKFFHNFYPDSEDPIPETTSRHATVHHPTVEHLTRENALLAIMLCASLLRQQQDWIEEVRDY